MKSGEPTAPAGAGLGRALAYHGADVLNIWRPLDYEIDTVYYTTSVGMRSATVHFAQPKGMAGSVTWLPGRTSFSRTGGPVPTPGPPSLAALLSALNRGKHPQR